MNRRLPYRPEIDGLRAIAVLLVIFHHIGDWFGLVGGYVGVDVFFVISGYLITGIVKGEIDNGEFSIGRFYKRRIVRLAPAYFLVLATTTVAAIVWMLPAELLRYARSALASTFFVANVEMWRAVGGYFGSDAASTPLLHLWSLAVEEQFYLFWPLLLLLARRMLGQRWLLPLVALGLISGIVISEWGVRNYPSAAYYLLPTRYFELMAGAALAFLPAPSIVRAKRLLPLVGLAMIVMAACRYTGKTSFPGLAGLLPVGGAVLVIRYAKASSEPVGRVLAHRVSVWLGRVSYPAYLWHWPIVAFLYLLDLPLTRGVGGGVITITFLLAWLTHRYVELPARVMLQQSVGTVLRRGFIYPAALLVSIMAAVIMWEGMPARFPESVLRKSAALESSPSDLRGVCHAGDAEKPAGEDECVLGLRDRPVDFLLLGDSHANHFTGFLDELATDAGMRGYDVTRNNAPFLPGVALAIPNEAEYNRNFKVRNVAISALLSRRKFQGIVLAGNYAKYHGGGILHSPSASAGSAFEQGMRAALVEAGAAADQVFVITPVPSLGGGLFDCPLRAERFDKPLTCSFPAQSHAASTRKLELLFGKLKREFPDVVWIEPAKVVCSESYCVTELQDLPIYKDAGHLNDVGSRLLAKAYRHKFGNPLRNLVRDESLSK